ncbi:MAG: hypothetical protein QY305_08545 [Candidatus Brocadiaceae baterium WH-1]|nr:MAG: hypothetical protein QY305_08545 [Candidatus Jettenia sp. AMX2]
MSQEKGKENSEANAPATYADIDDLARDTGFKPSTTIEEGMNKFVEWYKEYYKI